MKSDDWRDMDSAPLNEYGKAYGPTVLLWCSNSDTPVAAYYQPFGSVYDNKPRWTTVEEGAEILCEDAVAWMPIAAPWSVQGITPKPAELKGETMLNGVKEITPEHAQRMREWLLETSGRLHQLVSDERMLKPHDAWLLAQDAARVANDD